MAAYKGRMRTQAIGIVVAALFASIAPGQAPGRVPGRAPAQRPVQPGQERVLFFANNETPQNVQEIATLVGAIAGIRRVETDTQRGSLTLRGTPDQIALGEWLFYALDQPAGSQQNSSANEYLVPDNTQDVVRVFYLTHNQTPEQCQEIATLIRSTADIRRLFIYHAQRALAMRGTADQMAMAEWLRKELDQPANEQGQHPAMQEYRAPSGEDDVVRVLYLGRDQAAQNLQPIASLIRSIADVRRLFTYDALNAVTLRGTMNQAAMAEWLVNDLDRRRNEPAAAQSSQDSGAQEYRASDGSDDVLRVFYLTHVRSAQEFQRIAGQVRGAANIPRIFTYNPQIALAVRGTADQIAAAGKVIQKLEQPEPPKAR
jgi:hypothetical protein